MITIKKTTVRVLTLAVALFFLFGFGMTDASAEEQPDDDKPDPVMFSFTVNQQTQVVTKTVNGDHEEEYYRLTVPDFIKITDLIEENGIYNVFEKDDDKFNKALGDATTSPFSIGEPYVSSFARYIYKHLGNEDYDDFQSYANKEIDDDKAVAKFHQSERDAIFLEDRSDEDLSDLYVIKELADEYREDEDNQDSQYYEMVSFTLIFETDEYGSEEWADGYDKGYDDGYDSGYGDGTASGESDVEVEDVTPDIPNNELQVSLTNEHSESGFQEAYDEVHDEGFKDTTWIDTFMSGFGSFFGIELFPNITIGMIVGAPIVFKVMSFIFGFLRGR